MTIRIAFNTSGSIAAGTATAAFDSTTQTLNVTVANTGVTSAATIANAINSEHRLHRHRQHVGGHRRL